MKKPDLKFQLKFLLLICILASLFFTCKMNPNIDLKGKLVGKDLPDPAGINEGNMSIIGEDDIIISNDIPIPSMVNASRCTFNDRILLTWDYVSYGKHGVTYLVYRSTNGVDFARITNSALDINEYTQWISTGSITAGTVYYYSVRAYVESLKKYSRMSAVVNGFTLSKPKKITATLRQFTDKVDLVWDAVPGANYYTLWRAPAESDGTTPTLMSSYKLISSAVHDVSFVDYSVQSGKGSLYPQQEYFYILYAHLTDTIVSSASSPARGGLLAIGTPPQPQILDVTKGLFSKSIRLMWKDVKTKEYIISRVSQSDRDSGNYDGTQIAVIKVTGSNNGNDVMTENSGKGLLENEKYWYFYDSKTAIQDSETYYYRVAGVNDMGIGKASAFVSPDDIEASRGVVLSDYTAKPITVLVTRFGFRVNWEKCKGASGYYIYRADKDPSAYSEQEWTYIDKTDELTYLDKATGYDLESKELFYRIYPYSKVGGIDVVDEKIPHNINTNLQIVNGLTIANLIDNEFPALTFTQRIGSIGYSAVASDFTVPVPVFDTVPFSTKGDDNYLGTIKIGGSIALDPTTNFKKLKMIIVRTSQYGDETGVYPLAEPRKTIGGVSFTKKGLPHIVAREEVDITTILNKTTGDFEMLDPMHDFRNGKPLPDPKQPDGIRKHIWNYAEWDTEAWKDIKRKKPFNMERAVVVKYEFRIERVSDPEWNPTVVKSEGWPSLTDFEFCHLSMFLKDVAMNRLSLLLIPRYGYDETVNWLPGCDQQVVGEYNKALGQTNKAYFSAWMVNLTTAGGRGGVDKGYTDWPGFSMSTSKPDGSNGDINMEVPVGGGVSTIENYFDVVSPLYSGYLNYRIEVESFNYHWGVENNNGYVKIQHKNKNQSGYRFAQFAPGDVILHGPGSPRGKPFNTFDGQNGDIKGVLLGREAFDTGSDPYPWNANDFSWNCNFTRINFKYRPYPMNTDFKTERYPVMYYGYQY